TADAYKSGENVVKFFRLMGPACVHDRQTGASQRPYRFSLLRRVFNVSQGHVLLAFDDSVHRFRRNVFRSVLMEDEGGIVSVKNDDVDLIAHSTLCVNYKSLVRLVPFGQIGGK